MAPLPRANATSTSAPGFSATFPPVVVVRSKKLKKKKKRGKLDEKKRPDVARYPLSRPRRNNPSDSVVVIIILS